MRQFNSQQETLQNYKLATANLIMSADIIGLNDGNNSPKGNIICHLTFGNKINEEENYIS